MTTTDEAQYKALPTEEKECDKHQIPESFGFGVRHVQAFIIFTSLAIAFIARVHLGITIVAMTDPAITNQGKTSSDKHFVFKHGIVFENKTVLEDTDFENVTLFGESFDVDNQEVTTDNIIITAKFVNDSASNTFTVYKTYVWPKYLQEMVLNSFFLGYSIMMFPMGLVCQRWGGKLPIQIALFINGVVSILTPYLAAWGGWRAVCACRFLQGLSQAGLTPSIQILIAKWTSPSERGRLSSFIYTGSVFGTIIAFQTGGVLAASNWGWPSIFWATGALCLMMFTIVTAFTASTPLEHKFISEKEKYFIWGKTDNEVKVYKVPWKAMLTTRAVWASISAHVGGGLAFAFFFVQVPSYIHYILGISVKDSGILSSLPYIGSFIATILFGIISDFCTNRNILSIKNARRISNSIAYVGLAVSLLIVSFTTKVELTMFCLVFALSTGSGAHTGWMINHIDIARNYTATLMALGNTITSIGYLILPVLISFIITDVTNRFQWRIMFLFVAALALISNAIFVIFMSSNTQPWNDYGKKKIEEKTKDAA